MTNSPLRPDARLVQLHAERGDPQARLADALAALEDADWGLLYAGEAALARQLVALLGAGTLRVDGRIHINRRVFAEAGLAVADLYGDLAGARAALLLEPDERALERAARAGVAVIVDATLAPGGGWPLRGADYVIYRDGVTLSGHTDAPLAALFGNGQAPAAAAGAPSDLAVALALRDVATLPLRLARAARTIGNVAEHLGGSARPAGPTALLLAPDTAADTLSPLGGVLAATRHVPEGVLLTPGLEDTNQVLSLLRAEMPIRSSEDTSDQDRRPDSQGQAEASRPPRSDQTRPERRDNQRRFERRDNRNDRQRPPRSEPLKPDQARPDQPRADRPNQAEPPERFTFEAAPEPETQINAEPAFEVPNPSEETWEPEIVFSDLEHTPAPLTHTVSNGPDAPDQREGLPDVLQTVAPLEDAAEDAGDAAGVVQPTGAGLQAAKMVEEHAPNPAPDLPAAPEPAGKEDPAANLTDEQAAIYSRLRDWRNAEAKRQEISRFIVASNAALADIARRIPYTIEDLAEVRGMGPARLGKYGEKILEVVKG